MHSSIGYPCQQGVLNLEALIQGHDLIFPNGITLERIRGPSGGVSEFKSLSYSVSDRFIIMPTLIHGIEGRKNCLSDVNFHDQGLKAPSLRQLSHA